MILVGKGVVVRSGTFLNVTRLTTHPVNALGLSSMENTATWELEELHGEVLVKETFQWQEINM